MNTRTHTVPAGTMTTALVAAGVIPATLTAFDFDLVAKIKDLKHKELRNRVLSRFAFACDAYISLQIQRAVTALRVEKELEGAQHWDTYQAFLQYVAGIASSEQGLQDAGMEVTPLRETCQKLFNVRMQIHDILLESIGTKYEVPDIRDWMRNPKLRRDDAQTLTKLKNAAKHSATDEDGVMNVELALQTEQSYALKRGVQKEDQLKWDKHRGELSAVMFEALKLRDDTADAGYADENEAPFLELSDELQFKLLDGGIRYVTGVVSEDLVNDYKVTAEDHAAAAIESRPLVKAIKLAMTHRKFSEIEA